MTTKKHQKHISESHQNQIKVLRTMAEETEPGRHLQIGQIADITGLKDEKEVLRYLYILEGQKLVSPHPEGDFTSKYWYVTPEGARAVKSIMKAVANA